MENYRCNDKLDWSSLPPLLATMFIRYFIYPECNDFIHNTCPYRRETGERYTITTEREQKEKEGESSERALNIGTITTT